MVSAIIREYAGAASSRVMLRKSPEYDKPKVSVYARSLINRARKNYRNYQTCLLMLERLGIDVDAPMFVPKVEYKARQRQVESFTKQKEQDLITIRTLKNQAILATMDMNIQEIRPYLKAIEAKFEAFR